MRFLVTMLALLAIAILLAPKPAQAIPAFSKKYQAPCELCHSVWSKLNDTGVSFKINGYQMPNSEDGSATAKQEVEGNYFFDIGPASLPLSLQFNGTIILSQPEEGQDEFQGGMYLCCAEETNAKIIMAGSAAANVSYYLSLPWPTQSVEQGYIRIVNIFGPGMAGFDIGLMSVVDYDVNAPSRQWFSMPPVAFFGSPYNSNGAYYASGAMRQDVGARLYGRPGFGRFSYELGLYSGNDGKSFGVADDTSGATYTAMGRLDDENYSLSLRYWTNDTATIDFTSGTGDDEIIFAPDYTNPDETIDQIIASARYRDPFFEIDLSVDSSTMTIGERTENGSTLIVDSYNRLGVTFEATFLINNWFTTGVSYGVVTLSDYTQTVDGEKATTTGFAVSMFEWRAEIEPAANMRIGLVLLYDLSDDEAREKADGSGMFELQSKALLTWELIM